MGRQIITERDLQRARTTRQGAGQIASGSAGSVEEKADSYGDRLIKNIPAEVLALYVFLSGVLHAAADAPPWLHWAVFVALLIGTPFYLKNVQKVEKLKQRLLSTGAFAVWVFSLGAQGPFAMLAWYRPVYGALLLPLYTFAIAGLNPDASDA